MAIRCIRRMDSYIAYHAQLTAGYEADRWQIMLYNRKAETDGEYFGDL